MRRRYSARVITPYGTTYGIQFQVISVPEEYPTYDALLAWSGRSFVCEIYPISRGSQIISIQSHDRVANLPNTCRFYLMWGSADDQRFGSPVLYGSQGFHTLGTPGQIPLIRVSFNQLELNLQR